MTYAAEAAKAGKRPITVVEIDLDKCSKTYGDAYDEYTGAGYNDNLCDKTEDLDTGGTWVTTLCTVAEDATSPPPGVDQSFILSDTSGIMYGQVVQTIPAARFAAGVHIVSIFAYEGSSGSFRVVLYDTDAPGVRGSITFAWSAGDLTVSATAAGSGAVEEIGSGWWRAIITTTTITASHVHTLTINPSMDDLASQENTIMTGAMVHAGSTALEYQYEDTRDSTATNVRLTTSPLTIDAEIGDVALINGGTEYTITDNGTGYVRVTGDASGEGASPDVAIGASGSWCTASGAAGSECYNTRATCQAVANYDNDATLTLRYCEACLTSKEQVEIDAIPSVRSASVAPAVMAIGEGLGQRGTATVTVQDHPHTDVGTDPYVATRSYTPEAQGTYWAKLRARNPYYQGRALRIKRGYVTDPIDLTNNFHTHHYLLDRIEGPDGAGRVRIVGKDVLKLADDERAQAPVASEGVLDANINDSVTSATLSPAGIGNSDYPASGTLRIGEECMTFTRAGDALTVVRGTDGTTAAAHSAGETVQLCVRYSSTTLDLVLYDLLVTYANVDSTYIDTAAWETEVTDWLSGHSVTALITEPTGVRELVNEVCQQYLVALWWDDIDEEIDMKVLAPSTLTYDALTDAGAIVADSVEVRDAPETRASQVWVYYNPISPVEGLDDPTNYRTVYVYVDTDAESAAEYGEQRIKKHYSRWIDNSADATRTAIRELMRLRDNKRRILFTLSAADDYHVGDVVEVTSDKIVGADGAAEATRVEIVQAADIVPGHTRRYGGEDYAFDGRYFMIAPDTAPDYGAASENEKRIYGYICANNGEMTNGDDPYKIV